MRYREKSKLLVTWLFTQSAVVVVVVVVGGCAKREIRVGTVCVGVGLQKKLCASLYFVCVFNYCAYSIHMLM